MGNKGKTKRSSGSKNSNVRSGQAKVAQEKALEFDEKYRTVAKFKRDLLSLRAQYGDGKDFRFQGGSRRAVPVYSEEEIDDYISRVISQKAKMDRDTISSYRFAIDALMLQYDFSREWRPHFELLILTGLYMVPRTHYWIESDDNDPKKVSIVVGPQTKPDDVKEALLQIQKQLHWGRKGHGYAKSYSWINDPLTVDALKKTSVPYININSLTNEEEKVLYEKHRDDPVVASDKILARRTKYRKAGERAQTGRPKFVTELSDREYFKKVGGLKKGELTQAVETLKKRRAKYKDQ